MTIVCKDDKCYYYDRGFCSNELTAIDRNGMCEAVWHNGQPRPSVKEGKRMPIHILNIIKKEKEFNEDENVVSEENEAMDTGSTGSGCVDGPEITDSTDGYDSEENGSDDGSDTEPECEDSGAATDDEGDGGDDGGDEE